MHFLAGFEHFGMTVTGLEYSSTRGPKTGEEQGNYGMSINGRNRKAARSMVNK
jgi:hypothetical protein